MKKCNICGEIKNEIDFENGRNKCKLCRSREQKNREKSLDLIMYYCKRMAYDSHSRIFAPSRKYKTGYRNLKEPFDFERIKDLQQYLYDNFYNDIKTILDNNDTPSIDRIDSSIGYTPYNIRILTFKQNTELGVEHRKKKVKLTTPQGEAIKFNSVFECANYFGITEHSRANKVSSWIKNDKKYKRPEGYSFEYVD